MSGEKITIEKDSVQETLLIPLYGRKLCAELFPDLYTDLSAKELCDRLDYDFSEQEAKKNSFLYRFATLEVAMRQLDMMWEIKHYLNIHPHATVVNLGCGLDQTGRVCDNGTCRIVNIDFPDTIAARNQLIPAGEREKNIACDLKDDTWMQEVDGSQGVIFFASGVFYYFKRQEVKDLVLKLARKYSGGRLVFDSVGKTGLKIMLSQYLKNMGIKDVGGFFYINQPNSELKDWSSQIDVSTKGYMLGYYRLHSQGIDWRHRLLAKIGDKWLKMAIMRIDFCGMNEIEDIY